MSSKPLSLASSALCSTNELRHLLSSPLLSSPLLSCSVCAVLNISSPAWGVPHAESRPGLGCAEGRETHTHTHTHSHTHTHTHTHTRTPHTPAPVNTRSQRGRER